MSLTGGIARYEKRNSSLFALLSGKKTEFFWYSVGKAAVFSILLYKDNV